MQDEMTHWYRQLLGEDFATFIGRTLQTVNPGASFLPNWHIDLLAEYLEAARKGQCRRLLINLPPRSLKSVCVSVAWPAWLLGHDPSCRIIAASYSSALSLKHSLDCRLLVSSAWFREVFPALSIASGQNEKHKFATTRQGFRFATSVGGSLTGEGGQVMIIDDPLNPKQAMSAHYREQCRTWFDQTVASRLDDKQRGVMVAVMQRLHSEDLSAHLLAKGGWEHVMIPAISDVRRCFVIGSVRKIMEPGEMLHPAREHGALLEQLRGELGSHAFAAQYLQAPVGRDAAMVRSDWFRRYDQRPEKFDAIVQSWDTGIKAGDGHDPTACLTFGQIGQEHYLIGCLVRRVEYPDLRRLFITMVAQDSPSVVVVEDKASGQQLLQEMRHVLNVPMIACRPVADKVVWLSRVTPMIESGHLWLPKNANWLLEFEQQLLGFPQGAHDDCVDALSQYLGWVQMRAWSQPRLRGM